MRKSIKRAGIFLSSAFAVCLIGQVAYAQTPINYSFRLPARDSLTTGSVIKTNSDINADNYVSYVGWAGSGINWVVHEGGTNYIRTETGWFNGVGVDSINYFSAQTAAYLNGKSTYGELKTDMSTWHECDVSGKIYP